MKSKLVWKTILASALLVPTFGFVSMKESNSQVWGWGFGRNGQLGLGSETNSSLPQQINKTNFIDIDAKRSISAGITIDGKLYTWGKNRSGIIGHYPPNVNVLVPREVEIEGNFTTVSCGYHHMCAVTDKGEAYLWGLKTISNSFRQRGTSEVKSYASNQITPVKIELSNIKQVSCSTDYITLVNGEGSVFLFGKSPITGRQGSAGKNYTDIIELDLTNIKKVQSGPDFSLALSNDGKLYGWGSNLFGQLGTGSLKSQNKPVLLDHFNKDKIVDISCGDNFSGAVTQKGEVYTWGFGNEGQLGHGDKSDQFLPRKIKNLNQIITKISCGGGHTAIVTQDNQLLMMGRGREGQLGRQQMDESNSGYSLKLKQVEQLPVKKSISKVVCGGNHTMVLLSELV